MTAVSEQPAMTTEKPVPTKLYASMHKARAAMPNVAKTGINTYDKYAYANLADYLNAIQKALDDNGLIVVSHVDQIDWLDDRMTERGKAEKVCRIMLRTTVIHAESGESMSTTVLGEGQDRGDKAFYKADTGARKYALANLFNLATEDDPETDSPNGEANNPFRERAQQHPGKAEGHIEKPPKVDPAVSKATAEQWAAVKNFEVDKIVKLISAVDRYEQMEMIVDAAEGGEAWLDLREREQILNAVREKYRELVGKKLKLGTWNQEAFNQKMVNHKNKLDLDIQAEETFDRQATEAAENTV